MRGLVGVIALMALLYMLNQSFSIRVSPTVLFEGNAVRVTCHVPLDIANRRLQVALDGYRSSEMPLNESGPVTTEVTYDHVPCDIETASCTVLAATGALRRVATSVQVICRS